MNLWLILAVAGAGSLGAVLRFIATARRTEDAFPWSTLWVNVAGSALLGVALALHSGEVISAPALVVVSVGLAGGFTTFSGLAAEAVDLRRRRGWPSALKYLSLTAVLGLAAAWACGWLTIAWVAS